MAISPPSDIVLDVLRAADPQQAAAAQAKLASARAPSVAPAAFSTDIASAPEARAAMRTNNNNAAGRPEAYQKFEAMVLQSFLQSMMPSDSENVYGDGMAGDMWKSMLAEQIAGVMAKSGGIGIADSVMGDYTMERDQKVALTDTTTAAANSQRGENGLLSSALIDEMQRRMVQSIGNDLGGQSSNGIHASAETE